jgi:hypothetical protein
MNRKGVSTIIASVLLILLVLVAIVLLWYFIKPLISGQEEQLGTAKECLDLRVEPIKCNYQVIIGLKTLAAVDIKRSSADGNIQDLLFIFTDENETSVLASANKTDPWVTSDPIPGPNEYALMGFNLSSEFIPESVAISAVISINNKSTICPILGKNVDCPLFDYSGCADCNGDGILNLADFGCFQTLFSQNASGADFNKDGQINVLDFLAFTSSFNEGNLAICS